MSHNLFSSKFGFEILKKWTYLYFNYEWNFNVLASLCSGPGWFESHSVWNPKARFSHVMAHMYMCVGCGCSLLLIYVFSLCLRAPRKIDSSFGLPSLNKVVTCLLTYFSFSLCVAWCYSYTKPVEIQLNESYFCLKKYFVMISHAVYFLL